MLDLQPHHSELRRSSGIVRAGSERKNVTRPIAIVAISDHHYYYPSYNAQRAGQSALDLGYHPAIAAVRVSTDRSVGTAVGRETHPVQIITKGL